MKGLSGDPFVDILTCVVLLAIAMFVCLGLSSAIIWGMNRKEFRRGVGDENGQE